MKIMNLSPILFVSLVASAVFLEGNFTLPIKDVAKSTMPIVQKNDELQVGFFGKLLAPLYAGYGFTEEQKELARDILVDLEQQRAHVMHDYYINMSHQDLNEQEIDVRKKAYQQTMQMLDKEIQEQKIITGDAWSYDRKKIWIGVALVGAAGIVGLGALVSKYFSVSGVPVIGPKEEINSTEIINTNVPVQQQEQQQGKQEEQLQLDRESTQQPVQQQEQENEQKSVTIEIVTEQSMKEQQEDQQIIEQERLVAEQAAIEQVDKEEDEYVRLFRRNRTIKEKELIEKSRQKHKDTFIEVGKTIKATGHTAVNKGKEFLSSLFSDKQE